MATIAKFIDELCASFNEIASVDTSQCEFHEASGQLVIAGAKTRVVPVALLYLQYVACKDASARDALVATITAAFIHGEADVPDDYVSCGTRLLPQLWPIDKIAARQSTLPQGHDLPTCGIHGEERPSQQHGFGVVLVCEYIRNGSDIQFPAIETPVLSSDLARWGVPFVDALQRALENLRMRTKESLPAENRWEHHPTGCAQSSWQDRFDAARAALLPRLVVQRKRPDGHAETGGHVVAFATTSCVLATTSKNPLGLCFMGDTLHLKIAIGDQRAKANQLLSSTPFRLLKMREETTSTQHPLNQKASEGFVWRWLPYLPSGPPLRATGEFSVPVDQGEVDSILNAAESGKDIPVFRESVVPSQFAKMKEQANNLFKAGEYLKAIVAYDAALDAKPKPSNADAAIVHANAAQALLQLAVSEDAKREGCAAEALRRALVAVELDPTYPKAHARCAAACDLLGEPAAGAEARAKAEECQRERTAKEVAVKRAEEAEAKEERAAREALKVSTKEGLERHAAREAILERERAREREKDKNDAPAEKSSHLAGLAELLAKTSGFASADTGLKSKSPLLFDANK